MGRVNSVDFCDGVMIWGGCCIIVFAVLYIAKTGVRGIFFVCLI